MYNKPRIDHLEIMVHNIKLLAKHKGDREYDRMREGLKQTFISSFTKNV